MCGSSSPVSPKLIQTDGARTTRQPRVRLSARWDAAHVCSERKTSATPTPVGSLLLDSQVSSERQIWNICAEKYWLPHRQHRRRKTGFCHMIHPLCEETNWTRLWGRRRRKKTEQGSGQSADKHIRDLQAPTSNKAHFMPHLDVVSSYRWAHYIRGQTRLLKSQVTCSRCRVD